MRILNGIEIIDLALWIKKEKILIVSDFHLGHEETLKEKGIFIPKFQLEDILKRLKKIINKTKPDKIIINGDLKHEFGKILSQEWKDVLKLIDFLTKNCQELILIQGNHDRILAPIAVKRKIRVVEHFNINSILITHGDKIKQTTAKTIIIGHEHPAITLKEKEKKEKFKCFLKGKWKNKDLIVMPSFNSLFKGTDITKERLLSPYLKDISNFNLYLVGDRIYNFGRYKNLN